MKIKIFLFGLLILLMNNDCNGQNEKQKCLHQFDLNTIDFSNENTTALKKIFKIVPGSYGIIAKDNHDWDVNKNDVRSFNFEKKENLCLYFFNSSISDNLDYKFYLDLEKNLYAYSLHSNKVKNLEKILDDFIKKNKSFQSYKFVGYESEHLFKNFNSDEKILKFSFPEKTILINYVNDKNYPNNIIIRCITNKELNNEQYNILQKEYETYIQ